MKDIMDMIGRGDDIKKIELLINKETIHQNYCGETLLHDASWQGRTDVVNLLLEKGADVNIQNNDGETPLYKASCYGYTEVVKLLLEKGADINIQDNYGETPLYGASWDGYTEVVKLLLEKGADVNIQNNDGKTPLYGASYYGYTDVVTLLLEKGADVNIHKGGETPLYGASWQGHTDVVTLLLEKGADVNIQNNYSPTPLQIACKHRHLESAKVLVENGAEVDLVALNHINKVNRKNFTEAANKFNSFYDLLAKGKINDFFSDPFSTPETRWAVYKKYFNAQGKDFPNLASFKMFLEQNTETNLLHNEQLSQILSLPNEFFQRECATSALNKIYNDLTELFSLMQERMSHEQILEENVSTMKVLQSSDLIRYIAEFKSIGIMKFAAAIVKYLQNNPTYNTDPTLSVFNEHDGGGEEESKDSGVLLVGDDSITS